ATVNQSIAPSAFTYGGYSWDTLGTVNVTGGSLIVTLGAGSSSSKYTIADAIRIERVGDAAPGWDAGQQIAVIAETDLDEVSGLTVSRDQADVFWMHNDSGDDAKIYAVNTAGQRVGTYELSGVSAVDWEDIAIGPGADGQPDNIFIGDFGDNGRVRPSIRIYRLPEPNIDPGAGGGTVVTSDYDTLILQYPGGVAYDCETIFIDPIDEYIYLVTKDWDGENLAHLYRTPMNQAGGSTATLELVGSIAMAGQITGGDIMPDGSGMILRQYDRAFYWNRYTNESVFSALSRTANEVTLVSEPKGEAIGFSASGRSFYTTSEGINQSIYYYAEHATASIVRNTSIDLEIAADSVTTFGVDNDPEQGFASSNSLTLSDKELADSCFRDY
ncbi:MAG: hypothetical protein CBB70_04840, partial [Planctomycetaceae bacterium TMED10]